VIGRRVRSLRGESGVVTAWEPLGAAMTDTLVMLDSGTLVWFGSADLRAADDLGPLPSRRQACERTRVRTLASLKAIRAQHVAEWSRPWPGCEHGKALIGRAIDGAIDALESEAT